MKSKTKTRIVGSIILAFALYSVVVSFIAVFGGFDFGNASLSAILYSSGRLAGLLAFFCLGTLVFSGEVSRFFDKFFGMDRIIKFQRKYALVASFFALLHPLFFVLSGSRTLGGVLVPDFSVVPIAMGTISLYLFAIVMVCSELYKKISYKMWQVIHIVIYLLFFFSLYHGFNAGSSANYLSVRIMYLIILVGVLVGMVYRTTYKIRQKKTCKHVVDNVEFETHDTYSLTLKPKGHEKLEHRAGQFCFIRLDKEKLYARHPFTIASAPQEDHLRFTIKFKGRFTKIASRLKKGEITNVEGPFGKFTVDDDEKDLVFIAGGVGITPFRSIIKEHLLKGKNQKVTLIYGAMHKDDIIFKKFFDSIKQKWFKKVYVLSEEKKPKDGCECGFIDDRIIKGYVDDINNSIFYICGPEIMKDKVMECLKGHGVPKDRIRIEDFFW